MLLVSKRGNISSVATKEIAWTIGGSDCGGGAGIQADLKTMTALGVHGCTVVAALTAQNTLSVSMVEATSPAMLTAQLHSLLTDLPASAVKLGMLYNQATINTVADFFTANPVPFLVTDPVIGSTSGDTLLLDEALSSLKEKILPITHLLTPNLPEAIKILGIEAEAIPSTDDRIAYDSFIEDLGARLIELGPKTVLIKGGHRKGSFSQDYFTDGRTGLWLTSLRRTTTSSHGTGCTLSAAIASAIAKGHGILDSLVIAKSYVNQALDHAPHIGHGVGPLGHETWTSEQSTLPWLTFSAEEGRQRLSFKSDGEVGFYPIVDRAAMVQRLVKAGVKTVQLRIKDLSGDDLEREIREAVKYARESRAHLYVNDYWEEAIKCGAYGVHLGQADLSGADVAQISASGLRLGVSTHCYFEVARALTLRPSYIAIGPVYPTTTKAMPWKPQGLDGLAHWRRALEFPLVAIGGIFLDNAQGVLATGIDGIACVRDLAENEKLEERVEKWLRLFERYKRETHFDKRFDASVDGGASNAAVMQNVSGTDTATTLLAVDKPVS